MYFLSWKYRWFSCSSHSIREILLWCRASLQSTSIIWAANLSLISTYFYNVWVRMSAESSSRFKMSWSSWDLMFSTLNSSISRFMKVKICKSAEIIENKCNWTESKVMICDWSFMTLILKTSRARMKNLILIVLKKNVFEHIVWNIDFYHNLVIWIIVTKNNLESEDFLKNVECNLTFLKSDKENIFSDEMNERDSYSTIVIDESSIEVREI